MQLLHLRNGMTIAVIKGKNSYRSAFTWSLQERATTNRISYFGILAQVVTKEANLYREIA
jgi:hypothetical protein